MKNKKIGFLKKRKPKVVPEFQVRRISQKQMNCYFWIGAGSFLALSTLVVASSTFKALKPTQIKPEVKQVVNQKLQDNRLENFLNGYVKAYFTRSKEGSKQVQEEEVLMSYYNFIPDVKGTSRDRQATELIKSELLYVDKSTALYRVAYQTGEGDEKKEISVNFGIPYGVENDSFYVSGLPYFLPVEDYKALQVKKDSQLKLEASSDIKDKEELDNFLKVFFENYTTSQDNLNIVAKDVVSINGVVFKSLDYSYYKKTDKKIMAYAQATLEVAGTDHSENFTFTIVEKNDSYYIEKLEHVIPVDYAKK